MAGRGLSVRQREPLTVPRVAVVGSVMTDMVVGIGRMPELGETLEGTSFAVGNGGKGANQAVIAAMLGAEVKMVACVGDDAFGAAALDNFAGWGIGTGAVRRIAGTATGVAPILVDPTGENRIVIIPGANAHMPVSDVDAAFDAMTSAPDAVLCQLEIPPACIERALRRGRDVGAVTILNPAPFAPVAREVLQLADWIVPNEIEFEALRGQWVGGSAGALADDVAALSEALDVAIALTCGADGALLCHAADPVARAVPAPAATAVDTTGAGDAFTGAFAYALARGVEPSIAGGFACACASSSVQRPGTQSSYPLEPELSSLKSMLEAEPLPSVR